MLKSYGVGWVVVVAHEILVSAQGPLVFGFLCLGLRGLGPGLDNLSFGVKFICATNNAII